LELQVEKKMVLITVIVDNTISDWYTEHVRLTCAENNIPFYTVAGKGAYVLNFTP
jgi:ribosomal protein L7Ae-like RNA K-turn-binding protein